MIQSAAHSWHTRRAIIFSFLI